MCNSATRRQKIAILGGGAGSMAAAFALTERPGWSDRYDVTVYQMGWRLGGKCASGRNAQLGQRIEEHGLHTWMGFYDNAFAVMQRCYRELGRPPGAPLATWQDAFKTHSLITVMEHVDGAWLPWTMTAPTNDDVPGDDNPPLSPWNYVCLVLEWMLQALEHAAGPVASVGGSTLHQVTTWLERAWSQVRVFGEALWSHLHHAHKIAHAIDADPAKQQGEHRDAILTHLDHFCHGPLRPSEEEMMQSAFLRRAWINLELGAAIVRGLIADQVIFHGFDCLNEYDFTEWLRKHGAADERVWWSAPVRGIYDLVFGYDNGDSDRPNLEAGTALRGCLRMFFGYRGAIFWKMQAGMGDTVFTPLYEVLRRRGVRFEFFQRVDNLGLSADRRQVERIDLGVQATVKAGPDGYRPLVAVKGLDCWPSAPLYDQLAEGDKLRDGEFDLESAWTPWPDVGRRTLRRGEDFDLVVLGISLGPVPHVCRELLATPAWNDMVRHVRTVPTQAFQVWLNQSAEDLGGPPGEGMLATAYAEPLDTWADMSQLLDREDWPKTERVGNVTYFCGPLPDPAHVPAPFTDPTFPAIQKALVHDLALDVLRKGTHLVFPGGTSPDDPGTLRWGLLVDRTGGVDERRFEQQYWRANVDPAERYVQSVKGSSGYRLRADRSGFENLYLAGDWVATGLNAGCVEAAVMGGLQAARAICGHPELIPGESDL